MTNGAFMMTNGVVRVTNWVVGINKSIIENSEHYTMYDIIKAIVR